MYARICPCLSFEILRPYFDVKTHDIKKRLIGSLLPFNQKFYQSYIAKPDLYGPFWILWTLIVVLTISGNFSRYLAYDDPKDFEYKFTIIPVAVGILFGTCIVIPLGLKLTLYGLGNGAETVPVLHGMGIYAYSFSSFCFSSLLSGMLPYDIIQWILFVYSAATSLLFLSSTYWEDLNKNLTKNKKIAVIAVICACQITLLLVFKLYFFHHMKPANHLLKEEHKDPVLVESTPKVEENSAAELTTGDHGL